MLITTTPTVQGHEITQYHGVICGEAVIGAHLGKDILASFTNIVGGRSEAYESTLRQTRDDALAELVEEARKLGANAIVGVKFDYTVIGQNGSMMMVAVSGTAVTLA
ncbi:MAG TPA: YbjQ family protein [Hyphomonas sp.]|nr:YbjQ family protein [Hyphomonas sp.]MCB9962643.1 YbjQ family protein [Hyphomonas sp.]MCB9972912.1 YbjQ family protein [Hyphomonas sp.]HPE47419.1 YbjQ family protein [Hyphomonas sp.]